MNIQDPGQIPVIEEVDVKAPPHHEYEYAGVPPDAVMLAVPLHKPKQVTFVLTALATSKGGSAIVTVILAVDPTPSVTFIVYVPAQMPVKVPAPL